MATEIKKTTIKKPLKAVEQKPRMHFAFERKNYMILLFGLFLIILGYILLAGGGTKDPNQFNSIEKGIGGEGLFSIQRMVTAPIILMLGYVTIAVAIMYKEKPKQQEQPPVS